LIAGNNFNLQKKNRTILINDKHQKVQLISLTPTISLSLQHETPTRFSQYFLCVSRIERKKKKASNSQSQKSRCQQRWVRIESGAERIRGSILFSDSDSDPNLSFREKPDPGPEFGIMVWCIYSLFTWSKQKWLFWRAGFYPANQNNLKSFQKALIGWKKAGLPKKPLLFW